MLDTNIAVSSGNMKSYLALTHVL